MQPTYRHNHTILEALNELGIKAEIVSNGQLWVDRTSMCQVCDADETTAYDTVLSLIRSVVPAPFVGWGSRSDDAMMVDVWES